MIFTYYVNYGFLFRFVLFFADDQLQNLQKKHRSKMQGLLVLQTIRLLIAFLCIYYFVVYVFGSQFRSIINKIKRYKLLIDLSLSS